MVRFPGDANSLTAEPVRWRQTAVCLPVRLGGIVQPRRQQPAPPGPATVRPHSADASLVQSMLANEHAVANAHAQFLASQHAHLEQLADVHQRLTHVLGGHS